MPRIQVAVAMVLSACSGASDNDMTDTADFRGGETPGAVNTGSGDDTGTEVESDFLNLLPPAATTKYVFVANPDRDTVTRIAVPSLDVVTAAVGVHPAVLVTVRDTSLAATLDTGSDTVSIIDGDTLKVTSVAIRPHLDQMKLSPDARWVVCYRDPAIADDPEDDDAAESFYEVSLVELATGRHVPAVAGFEPKDVVFTPDGSKALLVSDAQVSLIDLTQKDPTLTLVDIADDPLDPPTVDEVVMAPDGRYAFVRRHATNEIELLDLSSRTVAHLDVGSDPSDLDLSADGAQAIAVAKDAKELWVYDTKDPMALPTILPLPASESFGSIVMSPDDDKGLLYTTDGVARYGVWDRSTDTITVRALEKSVSTIGVSPDGGTALVLHPRSNEGVDVGSPFVGKDAITLVDLHDFRANALVLPGTPSGYASSTDGRYGFLVMDETAELDVLEYGTLLYDAVPLSSEAESTGVVIDTTLAYVSQRHELGRISFYDPDTKVLETLTGFELNAAIEQK